MQYRKLSLRYACQGKYESKLSYTDLYSIAGQPAICIFKESITDGRYHENKSNRHAGN